MSHHFDALDRDMLAEIARGQRAEIERLLELIKQMQVMGRAVDNIAAAALEQARKG